MVRTEILAIGDELVAGHRIDTNSAWLAERLRRLGVPPVRHTTVGDELSELSDAIRDLARRSDVVISTGGLGPTQDDLTRQALALAAGVELELDESMVERIRDLFARRHRTMPDSNRVQAERPVGAGWIPNPHGTAPGIDFRMEFEGHTCRWFALPGVPAEMREMWERTVEPAIQAKLPDRRVIVVEEMKCFGVGESTLESRLPRALLRGGNPEIGITVSRGTITLRITAHGASEAAARGSMEPVMAEIESALGNLVIGRGDVDLPDVLVKLLRERHEALVTWEGPSRGCLADWLAHVDPRGDVYRGGILSTVTERDATEVMEQMEQLRRDQRATFALGILPLAEGEDALLVLIEPQGRYQKKISLRAHPDIVTDLAAKRALNYLRLHLLQSSD